MRDVCHHHHLLLYIYRILLCISEKKKSSSSSIPISSKFTHSGPHCVYAIFSLAGLRPHNTDY